MNERVELLGSNHLHTIEEVMRGVKQEMADLRKELNEHAKDEIRALDKILIHLEERHE